ncbi:uncharacterized protein LOC115649077 isoform X1 [Gopherus evgoodei]|uniref:uncharacterized protein LOC115649077 isoform X1 n=1 Tax=Gopherus evgoodei TaxID=1825980 RepID=UPI0011CFB32D|nr:uncharacterized protein LOC115649077 isoform X1 [Gopherus evgoodei]
MYYKFSGFSQKLVGAVASAAYVPQGLKPLASTESPTLIFGTPTKLASDSPAAVSYLGKNKVPDLQKLFQLEQALEFSLVKYRTLSTQHHLPAALEGASNCSTMGFESGPWPKIWSRAMWWRSSRRTHHHPLTCEKKDQNQKTGLGRRKRGAEETWTLCPTVTKTQRTLSWDLSHKLWLKQCDFPASSPCLLHRPLHGRMRDGSQ